MALKKYNPTTSSQRGLVLVDKSSLWKGKPIKALVEGKHKTGGRNNKGHVTSRGIAGGHKQKYRFIDFKRRKWDQPALVERLEYDPNRTAFIALVNYGAGEDGKDRLAYIIAPQRLGVGDKVVAGKKTDVKPGNAMELGQMPVGTIVHNVEMKPGKGGQLARSAGTYVQVVGRDKGMVMVRLNSGEQRYIHSNCMATVGAVSNPDNQNTNLGKAGRNRWKGIRPLTRGVAKNPVDHPHGGGEGRTSGGRHPVTPWGKPTKGARTRHNKSTDKMIIRSRHSTKRKG
jgi:large subunit ribosomal protein L2